MSLKIIQITDLHLFANPAARLMGIPTRETLAEVLADINRRHADLDLMIVTGDHTHDELPATYTDLAELLEPWSDRLLQIPGNHDDRELLRKVFPQTATGPEQCITFCETLGEWQLIGLDSHREGEVAGFIEPEQLEWLSQKLDASQNQPTALFIHHPPVKVQSVWMDAIGIENAEQLTSVIEKSPQVQLICAGHVHHEFESTVGSARLVTTPSTGIQFDPAGSTPSFTDLAPGYRVIILDGASYSTHVERLSEVRFTPVIESDS